MTDIHRILVAIDFAPSSDRALDLGVELAGTFGASLTVVHCWQVPGYAYPASEFASVDLLGPLEEAARSQMDSTLARIQRVLPGAQGVVRRGTAAQEILAAIEELQPDLVVLGTHGRRGIGRAMMGSVAETVVRLSPVPVLTVRAAARSAAEGERAPVR